MDEKNYIYLKNKVEKYNKLELVKENLTEMQNFLVKDNALQIRVKSDDVNHIYLNEELPFSMKVNEYDDLMREIKDNLIDSIGMKIVEINDKMEEL